MSIEKPVTKLMEHIAEATELAKQIISETSQSANVPVPLGSLPAEIQQRMLDHDIAISDLSRQTGVAINTVKKAISNPENMKIVTLQKVIAPLGLSLCFERQ